MHTFTSCKLYDPLSCTLGDQIWWEILDEQVDTQNENLKIIFPGFMQALVKK